MAAIIGFAEILLEDARRKRTRHHRSRPRENPRCRTRPADAGRPAPRCRASVSAGAGLDAPGRHDQLRHDLRTPLNAVKGYGEMVMEEARDGGHVSLGHDVEEAAAGRRQDALADRFHDRPRRRGSAGTRRRRGGSGDREFAPRRGTDHGVDPAAVDVGTRGELGGEPDPGRRRQRREPGPAHPPARARRPSGRSRRGRTIGAAVRSRRTFRSRAPRPDDAGDERLRGALPHEGRSGAARRAGDHDLGVGRNRQHRPLHRGGRRGLPAEAVQPGAAARAHQRRAGKEAPARPRARVHAAAADGEGQVRDRCSCTSCRRRSSRACGRAKRPSPTASPRSRSCSRTSSASPASRA